MRESLHLPRRKLLAGRVRELPEFVRGGPNVQFPRVALQLDQAGGIDVVTSLDGDVHHGPMLAATTTRNKPKTYPQIHAIGHATGTTPRADLVEVPRK